MDRKTAAESRPVTIFVSYAREDEAWKDLLVQALEGSPDLRGVAIWHDRKLVPGAQWHDVIRDAIDRASFAICLISPDYLGSEFCEEVEIPMMLEASEVRGLEILPVLVRDRERPEWQEHDWIRQRQLQPAEGRTLAEDFEGRESEVFEAIAGFIGRRSRDPGFAPPSPRRARREVRACVHQLLPPHASGDRRRREREQIAAALSSHDTHVVNVIGPPGSGKSTLVREFVDAYLERGGHGVEHVFAWSFYGPADGSSSASSDAFFTAALDFFEDPAPGDGSPLERAERLAGRLRAGKALLVMDGLDPFMASAGPGRGVLRDPGLATLVQRFARRVRGLCVATSRLPLGRLEAFREHVTEIELGALDPWAAVSLLRGRGLRGSDEELERLCARLERHPLALSLYAGVLLLRDRSGRSCAIDGGDIDPAARAVDPVTFALDAMAGALGDGPELELLRILTLFDRPADHGELAAVVAPPVHPGMNEGLASLPEHRLPELANRLRALRVLLPAADPLALATPLDAHPLVKRYFALAARSPSATEEGHRRLFRHLEKASARYPETRADVAPLYEAVAHGLRGGCPQEAIFGVYHGRIQRGGASHNVNELLDPGAELGALRHAFETPWGVPSAVLSPELRIFVCGRASLFLQLAGRTQECLEPSGRACAELAQGPPSALAKCADSHATRLLDAGELEQAEAWARRAIEASVRAGDAVNGNLHRTTLASVLHHRGRLDDAREAFSAAQRWQQQEATPPFLQAYPGYRRHDFLLDCGQDAAVAAGADTELGAVEAEPSQTGLRMNLLLANLALARAGVLRAERGELDGLESASRHFDVVLRLLYESCSRHLLPHVLCARAAALRLAGELGRAREDLEDALVVAKGELPLQEADLHVEWTRLHVAGGHPTRARRSLERARAIVEARGYHRRDAVIGDLHAALR